LDRLEDSSGGLGNLVAFLKSELKPRGPIFTVFNVVTVPLLVLGGLVVLYRLWKGLGAVGGGSQEFPLGIWIGLVVMVGVAFAGGAYVLCFVVYILNAEKYRPIIRITVLNGFLAYMFYASAIFLDLGRWWNIFNPIIGNRFGVNSVLFLVAWHFLLYMLAAFLEFSPAVAEWLGLKRARKILGTLTIGAVVFGIALSTLHQSGLGALFMMAKWKIHPLWYSEFIPILFFVSSIYSGLSVTIFLEWITRKVFKSQITAEYRQAAPGILTGLARGCAGTIFVYLFLKVLVLLHGQEWGLLATPMGWWYLFEVAGLAGVPGLLFLYGARARNLVMIRSAAVLAMLGIILNRLAYVMIAFKWYVPFEHRHFPSWMEIVVTLTIVTLHIWVFRWIVHRMPILRRPPAWAAKMESH